MGQISSILVIIIFVFALVWLGVKLHLFENKGDRGERIVGSKLFNLPSDYFILNDVELNFLFNDTFIVLSSISISSLALTPSSLALLFI